MANPVQNSLKQSNLSLNKIQSSVKSFSKSMSSARNTTTTLNKSLTESSRQKRKALQVDHIRFFRRRDAVRKRENENIIEASSVGGAIKRTGKVIADSTKGFLGRILDFFGVVLLGWLINHLPIIIKHATIAIQKLQRVVKILKGFISSIGNIFWGLGNILKGGLQNLLDLDITDQSGRVQQGFDQLNEGFGGLGIMLDDIGNVFSTWSPNEEGIDPTVNQLPDEEPEDEKPQGFMRGLAGAADFATFGLTDFDKRGDLFKGEDQQTQSGVVGQDQQTQSGVVGQGIDGQDIILNPTAAEAWENARKAAEQDGINLNEQVTSSFRSAAKQQELIDRHAAGDKNVFMPAPVGQSPHQQGWSVDINANSKANEWMRNRGSEFGFEWHGAEDPVHFDYMGPSPGGNDYWIQPGRRHWIPGSGESSISKDQKPQSKPQGLMRGLTGLADFATFGLTDFDKRGDLFESKPKGDQISANLAPSSEGEVVFIPMHSSPQPQSQPQLQPSSSGASQSSTIALNRSAGANELYKQIVLANLQYT